MNGVVTARQSESPVTSLVCDTNTTQQWSSKSGHVPLIFAFFFFFYLYSEIKLKKKNPRNTENTTLQSEMLKKYEVA